MDEKNNLTETANCAVPGCDGKLHLRGWCCRHYQSWLRYGDPLKAKRQHGQSARGKVTRTYRCWHNMIERCTKPNHPQYASYGGRGIEVCERWYTFENFFADMGEAPVGLWLERKDNNGNYEPTNCKWATPLEQGNNRRTSRSYLYRGTLRTVSEIARIANIARSTIQWRLNILGWNIERAAHEPLCRQKKERTI